MNEYYELYIKILFGFIICSIGILLILMGEQNVITYVASAFILLLGILVIVCAISKFIRCLCYESSQDDNIDNIDNNNENEMI